MQFCRRRTDFVAAKPLIVLEAAEIKSVLLQSDACSCESVFVAASARIAERKVCSSNSQTVAPAATETLRPPATDTLSPYPWIRRIISPHRFLTTDGCTDVSRITARFGSCLVSVFPGPMSTTVRTEMDIAEIIIRGRDVPRGRYS